MSEGIELKPCPFCGNMPKTKVKVTLNTAEFYHYIETKIFCPKCNIEYVSDGNDVTECDIETLLRIINDLIKAWNRRATDDGKQHKASTPN